MIKMDTYFNNCGKTNEDIRVQDCTSKDNIPFRWAVNIGIGGHVDWNTQRFPVYRQRVCIHPIRLFFLT